MSRVRVGVVGLGSMGRVHAENVEALGHELVAGADVAPAQRERFGREFDVPTYEDHEGLLAAESLDAVVVTTPNRFHEAATVAALEADCAVLVEKPLAHTVESAERIAATARRADSHCAVGFHNRYAPAAVATRAYRDAGRFGEIRHVDGTFVRRRGIPAPGSWFTSRELSGGGALIDVGVHALDLALDLLGHPPVAEVTGVVRSDFGGRDDYTDPDGFCDAWEGRSGEFDVEDSATAFVRFETGQTLSLDVAWATNRPETTEIVVDGTDAGARFDLGGETVDIYETGDLGLDHYADTELRGRAPEGDDGHRAELEQFLAAVAAGETPTGGTVDEALTVQRVIDAIYRSAETGRAVSPQRHAEAAPSVVADD